MGEWNQKWYRADEIEKEEMEMEMATEKLGDALEKQRNIREEFAPVWIK